MNRIFLYLSKVILILCTFLLAACQASLSIPNESITIEPADTLAPTKTFASIGPTQVITPTLQPQIEPTISMDEITWAVDGIPSGLYDNLLEVMPGLNTDSDSDIVISPISTSEDTNTVAEWIYVLVAPFPTVEDEVSLAEIERAWRGEAVGKFGGNPLLMSEETRQVWQVYWGAPAEGGIEVVDDSELLEMAWQEEISWALIPFEKLEPHWKALRVEGVSVFDDNLTDYPLTAQYAITGDEKLVSGVYQKLSKFGVEIPLTNRDRRKMTTVLLTGVTALSRGTAAKMEENGITYPGELIRDWMESADITHVSNEVPFYSDCPAAYPLRSEARFCSDPDYFNLLRYVGVDVVELTGNHLKDWGSEALMETLDLYRREGILYYGGGYNIADAVIPLEIDHNGNRLVFLGCNAMGPESDWATDTMPGSAPCDMDRLESEIKSYVEEGYLPIVTFQHFEICEVPPQSGQRVDFARAAEAGAVVVSGSQAHCPQGMTFIGDSFIHYGLGNLFFDQMDSEFGRGEFLDRHVFYDGRYIGVELLTAKLEDYAQPRPMTDSERRELLETVFEESVWNFQ